LKHGIFRPVVEDLLARLAPLDVSLPAFPVGTFAQTGIHHVGVLLRRISAEIFEILIPVTWAATIWELIGDAAAPFGYRVEGGRS
jgi:heterotetrameric sarcosine oxidase gamma subunit